MKKKLFKFISFVSFVILTMEVCNRVILYLSNTKNTIKAIVNRKYKWRLADVEFSVHGSGKPLLFIHDMTPGSSSLEWERVINKFAATNRVYVTDLPGFGISGKPAVTYTNYLYVSFIQDFIKNVIKEKTSVIASREAANTILMSAYNNSDLIDKIILINPASISSYKLIPTVESRRTKKLLSLPVVGTFIYLISMCKCSLKEKFCLTSPNSAAHINSELCRNYYFASHYSGKSARFYYASYIGNYVSFPIHHRLSAITNPILIINGENSKQSNLNTEEYISYNDGIQTEIIKNTSEFPHMEAPEVFYDKCMSFLNKNQNH